jgi:hypothetical protein
VRGPKHENWPVWGPRAAPPAEHGLKSGENGHLARANGAVDGPYCSPIWPSGPVCVEGGVSRWLAGVVVWGGGAPPAPADTRGWGCLLFNSSAECLKKTRSAQAFRGGPGRPGQDA